MAKRPRKGGSAAGGPGGPAPRTTNTDSSEYIRKRQAECRGLLEALNFQFYSHVCEQHKNNPRKSWAEGCQDYVKHMKKLMSDFKDVLEEEEDQGEQGDARENNNNNNNNDEDDSDSDDDGQPKTSLFGDLPKPTAFGMGAKSNPFAAGGGSGGAPSLFPPVGGAKSASNNPFAPSTTAFGGGGGSTAFPKFPAGGAAAQQAKEEENDEEPERPPSPSTAEATGEDDNEFVDMEKQKVKLYVKKEASEPWADRGVNRLQFRREKEGAKGACRILMRTSIGKAVINANLYDNMSVTFAEQKDKKDGSMKKTGVILTIFNACENSEKQIVLLKLGSQEAVEELHGLIVKNTRK